MKTIQPKFLTEDIADLAVSTAIQIMGGSLITDQFKRQACHIVILVPDMKDDGLQYADWPVYQLQPHKLYERSYGEKIEWSAEYDNIARCKALQLWHDRNDGSATILPHLLFPGDTPFWGGVKRDGIVVACSGVQPWLDRMLSGIVADLCIGLAFEAWQKSEDKKNDVDFLT